MTWLVSRIFPSWLVGRLDARNRRVEAVLILCFLSWWEDITFFFTPSSHLFLYHTFIRIFRTPFRILYSVQSLTKILSFVKGYRLIAESSWLFFNRFLTRERFYSLICLILVTVLFFQISFRYFQSYFHVHMHSWPPVKHHKCLSANGWVTPSGKSWNGAFTTYFASPNIEKNKRTLRIPSYLSSVAARTGQIWSKVLRPSSWDKERLSFRSISNSSCLLVSLSISSGESCIN